MSKKPPFILIREGTKLVAADPYTAERLDKFPEGKALKAATITLPRSVPFQGFYWVHLSNIVKATDCAPSPEHLHRALLKLCKYVTPVTDKSGTVIDLVPDSTAFENMGQTQFYEYVEKAKKALAEHLQIVWEDYSRDAA